MIDPEAALARLSSGNPQLDEILGGGFPANSINVVLGEPGSGKTILAERMMFANATDDRPILFFTTLSEPVDKVVRYLQQFTFFDPAKLGTQVSYEAIGDALVDKGIHALVPIIKDAIRTRRPKMIVIDSFKAIHDLAPSASEMRRMLFDLAGVLTAFETTVFLVGEYSGDQIDDFPEFAVADAMVELTRNKLGTRDERFLRVLKLRGSGYLEGLHGFRITGGGLEVFPRLVSPTDPPPYDLAAERVTTGIAGLDAMAGGGLLRGRSTFLLGATGTGKTTIALQFALEGVRRGEKCVYVSFEENPTQLDSQLRLLGVDPEGVRAKGLTMIYVSPVELQIDSIVATLFKRIQDLKVRRVVIDAVGDLISAANDPQRLHSYLYALTQHFAVKGVTSVLPYEVSFIGEADRKLSALADNIVLLGLEHEQKKGHRTIRIMKGRGLAHDLDVHELTIASTGVEVR